MKRTLLLVAAAILVVAPAYGQVASTPHNLSTTLSEPNGQVCVFCHTPHNADPSVPLWNHTLSTASYTAYDSPTMDAVDNGGWSGSDGNVSALCMSCHDGTIAVGSLVNPGPLGPPGDTTSTIDLINANANLGTDLTNDHPVAFTYDATLQTADGELNDPAGLTGAVRLFGAGADQVECASCHDPHDNTNVPFLVTSNSGSALCTTCHVK